MSQKPGRATIDKLDESSEPGHPQPVATETESARLLANEARGELHDCGLDDETLRELADEFIACDLGEDTETFVAWAQWRTRQR